MSIKMLAFMVVVTTIATIHAAAELGRGKTTTLTRYSCHPRWRLGSPQSTHGAE